MVVQRILKVECIINIKKGGKLMKSNNLIAEVYCYNCEHFKEFTYNFNDPGRCFHDSNTYYNFKGNICFKEDPSELNKNKNCKNYRKKWYKFWIK